MASAPSMIPTVCPGHSKGVWELNWASTADGQFFISEGAGVQARARVRDGLASRCSPPAPPRRAMPLTAAPPPALPYLCRRMQVPRRALRATALRCER